MGLSDMEQCAKQQKKASGKKTPETLRFTTPPRPMGRRSNKI